MHYKSCRVNTIVPYYRVTILPKVKTTNHGSVVTDVFYLPIQSNAELANQLVG